MNIHIETERFILRDIEESDVQGIFDLDSDPDVNEFLGKKPIKTLQEAEQRIADVRAQYKKNGIGRWAIEDKATGHFLGWSGLKYEEEVREYGYYDLGYRILKKHWGKGIATETALASLRYGFETMNLSQISGGAEAAHIVSNHILQKVGLRFVESFQFDGKECNWYTLMKEEWDLRENK